MVSMDETIFTYDGTGITLTVPTPEGLKTVVLFGLVALAIAVVLAGIRFWQNKPAWMRALRIHPNTGLNAGAWGLLTVFGALYVCVSVVLVGGLIWALSHVPDIIDGALYANDPSEARWLLASLAALTAVTSAAVALPFTVLKTIYNRRQTEVAEQNHITDQINKAVENLGATRQVGEQLLPNIQARIGGLVTLERIARSNRTVYLELMEMVAAYMVESLPETFSPNDIDRLRADLARCLQIISNRTDKDIEFEKAHGWRVNLDDADFRLKNLENVKFRNVSLHQADFRFSKLGDVEFSDIHGRLLKFDLARLDRVLFKNMDLINATFKFSWLEEVSFENVLKRPPKYTPRASGLFVMDFEGAICKAMKIPPLQIANQSSFDLIMGDSTVSLDHEMPTHWPEALSDRLQGFIDGRFTPHIYWPEDQEGVRNILKQRYEKELEKIGFDGEAPTG
jgi:hypothetical protein